MTFVLDFLSFDYLANSYFSCSQLGALERQKNKKIALCLVTSQSHD